MSSEGAHGDCGVAEPPQRLRAAKVLVGQRFPSRQAMTTAVRRHALSDGRQATCDSGGRRQASYRCVGRKVVDGKDEGCCFRVKACLQTRRGLNEWKITVVQDEHVNCFPASSGRKRGVGVQDVLDLGIRIVEGNPGISGPALGNSIRAETGLSVDPSLSRRLKRAALDSTMVGVEEGFKLIGSYLKVLSSGSPQTVTDIKVRGSKGTDPFCGAGCMTAQSSTVSSVILDVPDAELNPGDQADGPPSVPSGTSRYMLPCCRAGMALGASRRPLTT